MLRAGMDTKAVLQKCMDSVFGSALPYEQTSDAELKALAHAVTNGGIIQKHFSGVCVLAIHMSHTNEHDVLPRTIAQPQSCKRARCVNTVKVDFSHSVQNILALTLPCTQMTIGTGCMLRRW